MIAVWVEVVAVQCMVVLEEGKNTNLVVMTLVVAVDVKQWKSGRVEKWLW